MNWFKIKLKYIIIKLKLNLQIKSQYFVLLLLIIIIHLQLFQQTKVSFTDCHSSHCCDLGGQGQGHQNCSVMYVARTRRHTGCQCHSLTQSLSQSVS